MRPISSMRAETNNSCCWLIRWRSQTSRHSTRGCSSGKFNSRSKGIFSLLGEKMARVTSIKREIPGDALLLFRLGDFYEMFFDDAKVTGNSGARLSR